MKKILLFLSFLLMSIGMWGADVVAYTLTPASGSNNSYAGDCDITIDGITWNLNGNSQMLPWRLGGKSISSVDRTLYSKTTISDNITKIVITHGSASSITVNSMTVVVSKNSDFSSPINTLTPTFKANDTVTIDRPSGVNWDGCYYKIIYNLTVSSKSNKFIEFSEAKFYKAEACSNTVTISKGSEVNGTFSLDKSEVCADGDGGSVNVTYEAEGGYEFDYIETIVGNVDGNTVSGITANTTITVHFKEILVPSIDIAVWDTGYVKITIDNFNAATALLEDKDTQHTQEENIATELFFSKYFEAEGSVKLLGIYNGTKETKQLSEYKIKIAQIGDNRNAVWGGNSGDYVYELYGLDSIKPSEEIILITYTNQDKDIEIRNCILDRNPYGLDYVKVGSGEKVHAKNGQGLQFSGDDAIGLFKNNNLIDIIGAGTSSTPCIDSLTSNKSKTTGYDYHDDYCWIKRINDTTYISTNLCLLIRRNDVHSGDSAVIKNTVDFVTLTSEWNSIRVAKDVTSTCINFDTIGTFNYNEYYAQFTEIVSDTALSQIIDSDSTYKFAYNFTDLSCTELKVIVKDTTDKNNIKSHEEIFRIPIFIYNDSTVKRFKEKNCKECDVIVMGSGVLNVDTVELESRNVTIYPGGRLIVPMGKEYKMNTLTLRRDNDSLPHLLNNGTITLPAPSNYFFELRTDADAWRWTTLPSSHRVSDIKEHNGKPIKLGSEVFVRNYNGKTRAETQGNGWENTKSDSILGSGQGFIFGIDVKGSKKKTYVFTFPSDSVNNEKSNKTITGLRAWGCDNETLRPNHKGWNLVGNPFTDNDTTDIIDPIKTGELVKDSTGTSWNGQWVYKAGSEARNLRYAVIPVTWREWTADEAAAGGYASELLDDYVLPPFTSFFVQIGGDASAIKTLTFKPVGANPINRIVARAPQYDEDEELFLRVRVGNRKTGCFISNKFTDEYEPGDDLESRYPIYQSIGGYKLLYSAINDSIIEHGVQVTAPQGTLYIDPKVDINKFEYIYAHYNDDWYDLKNGQTAEVNGTFILQAKRKMNNTPTSLEDVVKSNTTDKFIYSGHMYIKKNNHVYSVFGGQVK